MSVCHISGRTRTLPKPNFFPIIPIISADDARKLCGGAGAGGRDKGFVTLLEVGKRPESVRSLIRARAKQENKENKSANSSKTSSFGPHEARVDFRYVAPVLKRDSIETGDLKAFDDLQKILQRLEKKDDESEKRYVYLMPTMLCGLVVPAEAEEAVRRGELESVSLSRGCDSAIFKVRGKPTLFVPLKEVEGATKQHKLFDGRGQSKETLQRQKQVGALLYGEK